MRRLCFMRIVAWRKAWVSLGTSSGDGVLWCIAKWERVCARWAVGVLLGLAYVQELTGSQTEKKEASD